MRCLVAFLLVATVCPAEILDRIAVSVGQAVITEGEVVQQVRLTAFQNNEQPDLTKTNLRLVAGKMVEQVLIRKEIEANKYMSLEAPNPALILQALKKRYASNRAYQAALDSYQITPEELQKQLQWQIMLVAFVDVRFRPGVQVPEAEIRDYYDKQYVPNWSKTHSGGTPSFDESKAAIENLIASDLADHALDRWLGQIRTQTPILFRPEVFQ